MVRNSPFNQGKQIEASVTKIRTALHKAGYLSTKGGGIEVQEEIFQNDLYTVVIKGEAYKPKVITVYSSKTDSKLFRTCLEVGRKEQVLKALLSICLETVQVSNSLVGTLMRV